MAWFGRKKKNKEKKDTLQKDERMPDISGEEKSGTEITETGTSEKEAGKDAPAPNPETDTPETAAAEAESPASDPALTEEMPQQEEKTGLLFRLKKGLSKTREVLTTDIDDLFLGRKPDGELLEDIEELLITSDMGVQTTMKLMEKVGKRTAGISSAKELKQVLKSEICALIKEREPLSQNTVKPCVIMVIGVNGVGKTTTIGKLAARFSAEGKKVLMAAADTFRAAAVEQLSIWAERSGADIVKHRENADPAAVAFDAVQAAAARDKDIVIVDTAGRLHTKVNLMEELKKIRRALSKVIPDAPHEVLLVLDATTGQNALSQARMFHKEMGVTGLILTKLDGTAKGGFVISICDSLDIPIHYIGVGEQADDLQPFDPVRYADALFS